MQQNKNLEPNKMQSRYGVEARNGQPSSDLQPPKLVVSKGRELNPRDILAKMAANPRANLYLT